MAAFFAVAAGVSTLLVAQSGCGGASVGGGIGGSGFVAGPIDELGSIVVEGIRFAIDDAEIVLNGEAASADDLALGMFVGVYGTFDEEEASGIATRVEFEESVSGTVTSASPDRKRIVVLGQSVNLDDSTRLAGISPNGLRPGVVVTVSGSRDADGTIVATFVARRLPVRGCRVLGEVAELAPDGSSFRIGDLEVDASQATVVGGTLVDGDRVGVFAEACEDGAALLAREIRRLETTQPRPPGKLRSVRGFVVEAVVEDRFRMNVPGAGTVVVEVTTGTEFERGSAADVSRNDLLRVTGLVNEEGILRAARIRFLRDSGSAPQRKDP